MFRIVKLFFIPLFLSIGILLFSVYNKNDRIMTVDFLNVGQGDAILIQLPSGQNILIDGGPDNSLLHQLGETLPWWERKIDYVIISHYHDDHFQGLIELLNHYQVGAVLSTAHEPKQDFLYNLWQDQLEKNLLFWPDWMTQSSGLTASKNSSDEEYLLP